jgi:hypothetical protein
MKTSLLTLAFSLMVLLPNLSQATGIPSAPDTLITTPTGEPTHDDELEIDLDESLWFQEKVYIHIYDRNEQPLVNGAFSRKDLSENKELKALLRKSTRFMSVDRHHYYIVDSE